MSGRILSLFDIHDAGLRRTSSYNQSSAANRRSDTQPSLRKDGVPLQRSTSNDHPNAHDSAPTFADEFTMLSNPSRPFEEDDDSPHHELDNNPRYLVLRNFSSRFLPDARNILVYLPEAYLADPTRRFPVFYLHDGQNLFDGRTSFVPGRTWRAHTTADTLTEQRLIEPVILVGIDNTGVRRMAEYTPTRDARRGGGEGFRYGKLLVEELKPLIDRTFRTLADAPNTALGGSSLGGLISLALGLDYPNIFGKLAVMSPSVWWDQRSILRLLGTDKPNPDLKIWLDMGTSEGLRHLRDTDLLHRRLTVRGWRDGFDLKYLRVYGGLHDEESWARRFDQVLLFLFPAGR